MSQIIIGDTETLQAWNIAYPELEGVLTQDSRISIIFPSEEVEDHDERIQSIIDQRLNASIPESRFLIFNVLSTQWTFTKINENPLAYPFLYFFGMVAYACALTVRVAIFAFALLRWVIGPVTTLCCGNSENFYEDMKERSIVLLGAFGEVVSGIIGVACPPLAYVFDEWIQKHVTIHAWYSSHRFSMWSDELGNASESEERVAQKNEAVKEDLKYFKKAKEDLASRYLSAEVDAMSPAALQLIMHFGFLDLFCSYCNTEIPPNELVNLEGLAGTPLVQYCIHVLQACGEDSVRENTQEGLLGSIEQFRKYWLACHPHTQTQEIWGYIATAAQVVTHSPRSPRNDVDEIYQAIKTVLLLNLETSVVYNEDDTKEELLVALNNIGDMEVRVGAETVTAKEAVSAMANAIQRFSSTIKFTDREMEGVILRNAYGE